MFSGWSSTPARMSRYSRTARTTRRLGPARRGRATARSWKCRPPGAVLRRRLSSKVGREARGTRDARSIFVATDVVERECDRRFEDSQVSIALGTRASVVACVAKALQTPSLGCVRAGVHVPRASILMCISQALQMPSLSCFPAGGPVPRASVLVRVSKTVEIPALRGCVARRPVPWTAGLLRVTQAPELSVTRCHLTRSFIPRAAEF